MDYKLINYYHLSIMDLLKAQIGKLKSNCKNKWLKRSTLYAKEININTETKPSNSNTTA